MGNGPKFTADCAMTCLHAAPLARPYGQQMAK